MQKGYLSIRVRIRPTEWFRVLCLQGDLCFQSTSREGRFAALIERQKGGGGVEARRCEAVDRLCFPPAAPLLTHMQTEIISISAKHKRKQLLVHNVCSVIAPCKKEKGCTREKRYCTTLKATKAE